MTQHTCFVVEGEGCAQCTRLADELLAAHPEGGVLGQDEMGKPASRQDMLNHRTVLHPLDVDTLDFFGMLRPTTTTDPQRAYDADPDAMRRALHIVTREAATSDRGRAAQAAAKALLASLDYAEDAPVRRTRADYKAAAAAVLAALPTAVREREEALRPDAATGERGWAVRAADDRRTLAGPVVTTDANGTALRITRHMTRHYGKGEERGAVAWTDVLAVRPDAATVADALTVRAVRTDGTRWTRDATTTAADRFAEVTESRGPVAKPNTRKRKRDGAIGGPAVITRVR